MTDDAPLLSEDEVRQRLSAITRGYEAERSKLSDAHKALVVKAARTQLAVTYGEFDKLKNEDAYTYARKAKNEGIKLTVADREAIVILECEEERINYDIAKLHCETTDKLVNQLTSQLSFYQSVMRLGG